MHVFNGKSPDYYYNPSETRVVLTSWISLWEMAFESLLPCVAVIRRLWA